MKRIMIVGEGPNELGSRAGHPSYQTDKFPGFIEAAMRKTRPEGWKIVRAADWDSIPAVRVRNDRDPALHRARGHALRTSEMGAALVLLHASVGHGHRATVVAAGIQEALNKHPALQTAVGVPCPKLEGWVLALRGRSGTETMTPAAAGRALATEEIQPKDTAAFVASVESADLTQLPHGCASLKSWLKDLETVLGP